MTVASLCDKPKAYRERTCGGQLFYMSSSIQGESSHFEGKAWIVTETGVLE